MYEFIVENRNNENDFNNGLFIIERYIILTLLFVYCCY